MRVGERKDERGGTQQNYECYTLSMPVCYLFWVFPGMMCCLYIAKDFVCGRGHRTAHGDTKFTWEKCFALNISFPFIFSVCQAESSSSTFFFSPSYPSNMFVLTKLEIKWELG